MSGSIQPGNANPTVQTNPNNLNFSGDSSVTDSALAYLAYMIAQNNNAVLNAASGNASAAETALADIWTSGTTASTAYSKLQQMLQYLQANPGSLAEKISFLGYLNTLDQNGALSDPNIQALLENSGIISSVDAAAGSVTFTANFQAEMQAIIQQGAVFTMFNGYTSPSGATYPSGPTAATAWLTELQTLFSGSSGPGAAVAQQINGMVANVLNTQLPNLVTAYGFSGGGTGSINIQMPDGNTATYMWQPTAASAVNDSPLLFNVASNLASNQALINAFINNTYIPNLTSSSSTTSAFNDPFFNSLPVAGGSVSSATLGTLQTVQSLTNGLIHSISSANSAQFVQQLYTATAYFQFLPQLTPFANSWNSNVFTAVVNTSMPLISARSLNTGASSATVEQVISGAVYLTASNSLGFAVPAVSGLQLLSNFMSTNPQTEVQMQNVVSSMATPLLAQIVDGVQNVSSAQFVLPDGLPGGGPTAVWPGFSGGYASGSPYFDQLNSFAAYLAQNPNSLTTKLNFLGYMQVLNQHGVLNNQDVQGLLSAAGMTGSAGAAEIQTIMQQGALYAMFNGYTPSGSTTALTGAAAANAWLTQMQIFYNSGSQTGLIATIRNAIATTSGQMSALTTAFGFANGGTGSIVFTNPDHSTTSFAWSNPADQSTINDYISNLANPMGLSPGVDTFFSTIDANAVRKSYMMASVDQLIGKYHNPEVILSLFLMVAFDNSAQVQIGGLANTTNLLNMMTNTYGTPLLQQAQQWGTNLTQKQALQFVDTLYTATSVVDSLPQFSSIAPTWNKNVFNAITQINVTYTPSGASSSTTATLGSLMQAASSGGAGSPAAANLVLGLQSLTALDTAGSGGASPAYQGVLSALQQGGALFTNQSQVLSTQISTLTSNDAQYIKFGGVVSSTTGGGFMQLIMAIIQGFSVTS